MNIQEMFQNDCCVALIKKIKHTETEQNVGCQALEYEGNGEMIANRNKLPIIRWKSSEDAMHNMVTIELILYTWKLLNESIS